MFVISIKCIFFEIYLGPDSFFPFFFSKLLYIIYTYEYRKHITMIMCRKIFFRIYYKCFFHQKKTKRFCSFANNFFSSLFCEKYDDIYRPTLNWCNKIIIDIIFKLYFWQYSKWILILNVSFRRAFNFFSTQCNTHLRKCYVYIETMFYWSLLRCSVVLMIMI